MRCVAAVAKYFGQSPEEVNEGRIREYKLYLAEEKKSSSPFYNQSVCALRFLYRKTLKNVPLAADTEGLYGRFTARRPYVSAGGRRRRAK